MCLAKLKMVHGVAGGLAMLVTMSLLPHEALADKPLISQGATKDELTLGSFSDLHKLIQPEAGEYRWDEVAWLTSIWHARTKAAAEDKPIFIFGTQGAGFNDPLGNC